MRGYYGDVAFPLRNRPNFPFPARHGLTGGLPDVGTEKSRLRGLIRRPRVAQGGGQPSRRRHCRISRVDQFLPTKFAEEIKGSSLMGPSKYTTSTAGLRSLHRWTVGLTAVLTTLCWVGLTAPANAQGAVRSVHGDWQIRCDTPPGAQAEQCALIQSVVAEDRSNAGLTVIVLKPDDQDAGRAGFVRCLPNGCVAEVVMDDKLLGQLRTAKTATFIIFETPEEGIGFPLSLNGIGEGYG